MRYRVSARSGGATQSLRQRREATQSRHLAAYLSSVGLAGEARLAARMSVSEHARAKLLELVRRSGNLPVPGSLDQVRALIRLYFGGARDLIYRDLRLGGGPMAMAVFLDTIVDDELLERSLKGFIDPSQPVQLQEATCGAAEYVRLRLASSPDATATPHIDQAAQWIAEGRTLLFIAGSNQALAINLPGGPMRSVEESKTERVMRGPREGFVESIQVNTTLVRRRIRDPRLRVDEVQVGEISHTRVAVMYIATICKQSLVDEVKQRIRRVKIDGMLDSGQLMEFIEDTPWTMFPLIRATERPDVVAGALLEGRCAVVVEGSPYVLVAPASILDLIHTPEDYYERFPAVFLVRLLRILFALVSLFGPSLYVAMTTFHREMIPTNLLLSIMVAREGVPFPAVLEALMMELVFEIIREAGVRMPTQLGQSISIVGALILGESAIRAGIVSAPLIITVAITGLASLMLPDVSTSLALRILRFPMLVLAGTYGVYGLTLGGVAILMHLLSLRSFGAPYMAPFGPLLPADGDDTVVRKPHWAQIRRPATIEQLDTRRAVRGLKPHPGPRRDGGSST